MALRLLGVILSLNISICVIAAGALLYNCEIRASAAYRLISTAGAPLESASPWSELAGVRAEDLDSEPPGVRFHAPFSKVFPANTRDAVRSVIVVAGDVYYAVSVDKGASFTHVTVDINPFLALFRICLLALLLLELWTVISETGKNRHMVHKLLNPITELTRAAQSISDVSKRLDPDKMAALAGKLEGINATRLDTRIQIDDTQEELKSLARAINNMLDRINDSYRAQVRFVSDASHELRTPISVIQGYTNLLDRWGKNDKKTLQESIDAIKEEAANMKELIEQLLFLARGDNDTIMLQVETFDLSELVTEVAGETKMLDDTHTLEIKPGTALVSADRALIKQALRILVDNAVKYTDPGGKIILASESDDGYAKLSVTDTGIGISGEAVARIFDRFYRTDESRTRATGGAGLGLSIAKRIASKHEGHMEVPSRESIGTKITILLPVTAVPLYENNSPVRELP